jgi:hypothetical protein
MAQTVSRSPVTAEARVRAPADPCGICGGQSGSTGTGFSPSSSVFPRPYKSTRAPHSHISSDGGTIGSLVAAVQRHTLTLSSKKVIINNWFANVCNC